MLEFKESNVTQSKKIHNDRLHSTEVDEQARRVKTLWSIANLYSPLPFLNKRDGMLHGDLAGM